MGDLLDEDYSLVEKNSLYRCLDKVLKHKEQLFGHLRQRWQDLFGSRFEVLRYDLTSTYFESDPVFEEADKRQFGYSRDKRSDCVQVFLFLRQDFDFHFAVGKVAICCGRISAGVSPPSGPCRILPGRKSADRLSAFQSKTESCD
jgi:hypothetical protein